MKKLFSVIFIILFFVLLPINSMATDFFFSTSEGEDHSCSVPASSNCSNWEQPCKTISCLNTMSANLADGANRFLLKEGDVWDTAAEWGTDRVYITNGGTAGNRFVLGAYNGTTGDYVATMSSNRPKLVGANEAGTANDRPSESDCDQYHWLVSIASQDYVTVENLEITESRFHSLSIGSGKGLVSYDMIARWNKITESWGDSITASRVQGDSEIYQNLIYNGARRQVGTCGKNLKGNDSDICPGITDTWDWGAAIHMTTNTNKVKVYQNVIYDVMSEAIGAYYNGNINDPIHIYENVIGNTRSSSIHTAGSNTQIYRNLIVYTDSNGDGVDPNWYTDEIDDVYPACSARNSGGIYIICTGLEPGFSQETDIYGNIVIGTRTGVRITSNECAAANSSHDNSDVLNNLFIANDVGIVLDVPATVGSNNIAKNNVITKGGCATCTITESGRNQGSWTIANNAWSHTREYGTYDTFIVNADLGITKQSDWRWLTSISNFLISDVKLEAGSPLIGTALPIVGYNDRIDPNNTNYLSTPIVVATFETYEIGTIGYPCLPVTPSITDPTPSEEEVEVDREVNSSAFADESGCSTSHISSDWEIDTTTSFLSPDKYSYDSTINKVTWAPGLPPNGLLYIRVRHTNANGDSAWSDPVYFETEGVLPSGGPVGLLITGDNNTVLWNLINGQNEESTGIKVVSGATGNKIYNTTVVNCGLTGIDVDESVTIKNTVMYNNAGPDMDVATDKTVTCDSNSFQDDGISGSGTYSCTEDFSLPQPFRDITIDYSLGAGVEARNGGVSLYSGIEYDLIGRQVTDGSGTPLLGGAIDKGSFEFNKNAMVRFRKSFQYIY